MEATSKDREVILLEAEEEKGEQGTGIDEHPSLDVRPLFTTQKDGEVDNWHRNSIFI